jgi:hypothetical protein
MPYQDFRQFLDVLRQDAPYLGRVERPMRTRPSLSLSSTLASMTSNANGLLCQKTPDFNRTLALD